MQEAIRGNAAAAVRARLAVERSETSTGFFDDDLHSGHIPPCNFRLDRDLGRPFRNQHVDPEVAEAAGAAAFLHQAEKLFWRSEISDAVVADLRVGESIDLRNADAASVAECAVAARSPPPPIQRRRRDDADLAVERNERREDRNAADVISCRVDRIDDPTPGGVTTLAEFLAEDRVIRPFALEPVADRTLNRLVNFRDRRRIFFGPHGERAAEVAESDPVADVRQRERESKIVVHPFQTSTSNLSFAPSSERSCWRRS